MNLRNGKLTNSAQPVPKRRYNKKMAVTASAGGDRDPSQGTGSGAANSNSTQGTRDTTGPNGSRPADNSRCLRIIQDFQGLCQFQCQQLHLRPRVQTKYYRFPQQMLRITCLVKARIQLSNGGQIFHTGCHFLLDQAYEGPDLLMSQLIMRHFHQMWDLRVEVHTTLVFLPRCLIIPQTAKQHFDKKWMQATMIC